MTSLAGRLLHRLLLSFKLDKYVDGLDSAKVDVVASNGWIPKQIEVNGELSILPSALAPIVSIDSPAVIRLAEGSKVTRIVLHLPSWLRDALVECLALPFTRSGRAPASSAAEGAKPPTDQHPLSPPGPSARPTKSPRGPGRMAPVVPPPPLHLPEAGAAGGSSSSSASLAPEERLMVEVHGLKVNLRTYTAAELANFRRDVAIEALSAMVAGGPASPTSGGAAAPGGHGEAPAEEHERDAAPDEGAAMEALKQRILEHLTVECYGVEASLSNEAGARAVLAAERLDATAVQRAVRERDEELWFGGERVAPSSCQSTLELRSTNLHGSCEWRGERGAAAAGEVLGLSLPAFGMVAVLPRPPEEQPQKQEASERPGARLEVSLRFAAPSGGRISLPGGVGGLRPLFSVINAINAAVAACDPRTLASLGPEAVSASLSSALTSHFARLWWQDYRNRQPSSRRGRAASLAPNSICSAMSCTAGIGKRRSRQPLTAEEEQQLLAFLGELPLATQAALLLPTVGAGARSCGPLLPAEANSQAVQRALCHAFAAFWPSGRTQVAVELEGSVTIGLGTVGGPLDMETPMARAARCYGARRDPLRESRLFSDGLPALSGSRPSSRGGTFTSESSAGVASEHGDAAVAVSVVDLGIYFSQLGQPYDWGKATRVCARGLVVSSAASGRELLTCNAGSAEPLATPAQPPGAAGATGVAAFRSLLASPPIAIESSSGCFAPDGHAGAPPWPAEGDAAVHAHSAPAPLTTVLEDMAEGEAAEASERPADANALGQWLKRPEQPPRHAFVSIVLAAPLRTTLWPRALTALASMKPDLDAPGLLIEDVFLDANFPPVSAVHMRVSTDALHVHVEEDTCSSLSLVGELRNGFSLSLNPASVPGSVELEAGLHGATVQCSTSQHEVRPVLSMASSLTVTLRTALVEDFRDTLLKVQYPSSRFCLDISPQLCQVAEVLAAEVQTVTQQLAQLSKDAESTSALSSKATSRTGSRPASKPNSRANSRDPGQSDASAPRRAAAVPADPSAKEQQAHRMDIRLMLGSLKVHLCDAISALLRIKLAVQARAAITLGRPPQEEVACVESDLHVTGLQGDFASNKEGTWEPFLEPWSCGASFHYTKPVGMELSVSDGAYSDASWEARLESALESAALFRPCPLLLNFTPQLCRAVTCFLNQVQQTSAGKSKLPVCLADCVSEANMQCTLAAASQPRIAALNLTGCNVAAWFYHGRDLHQARQLATAVHGHRGMGRAPNWPEPGTVLEGSLPPQRRGVPIALDPFITVPASTAVALELQTSQAAGASLPGGSAATPRRLNLPAADTAMVAISEAEEEEARTVQVQVQPHSSGGGSVSLTTIDLEMGTQSSTPRLPTTRRWSQASSSSVCMCDDSSSEEAGYLFSEHRSRQWRRQDRCPIMPLTAGWCVAISPDRGRMAASPTARSRLTRRVSDRALAAAAPSGWRRSEFVVQVLVPQPARRLLLVASPFRVFNYTDRPIHLAFQLWGERRQARLSFSRRTCAAATAPASLLGAQQPIDTCPLLLEPSPIGMNLVSDEEEQGYYNMAVASEREAGGPIGPDGEDEDTDTWWLPHNSFCCVPVQADCLENEEVCDIGFRISSSDSAPSASSNGFGSMWSQWVRVGGVPDREWRLCYCRNGNEILYFRVAALLQVLDEPYHVEVMNFVILPAFTVVNATPAVLAVDIRKCDDGARGLELGRGLPLVSPSKAAEVGQGQQPPTARPGAALHLYHVNSSRPLRLRVGFPAEPPDIPEASYWSDPIYDPCSSCAGRAERISVPFKRPVHAPAVEVMCSDFVAAVSCPFWLTNHSSLGICVGRRNKPFPVIRGITMLDGSLSDTKIYLQDALPRPSDGKGALITRPRCSRSSVNFNEYDPDVEQPGFPRSSDLGVLREAPEAPPELQTPGSAASDWDAATRGHAMLGSSQLPRCGLPVPVTSCAMRGQLASPDGGSYGFTIIREPLPPLFGEHAAPTTCFHLVPSVMVSNSTTRELHVRQAGAEEASMLVQAGESAPYWDVGGSGAKRQLCIQIQLVDSGLPLLDAWSGDIPCDSSANGRIALAVKCGSQRTTCTQQSGDRSPRRQTTPGETVEESHVLSVEISDAIEGMVSISVSEKPGLVVGCWSQAVSSILIKTDAPPIVVARPGDIRGVQHAAANTMSNVAALARAGAHTGAALAGIARTGAETGARTGATLVRDAGVRVRDGMQGVLQSVSETDAAARVRGAGAGIAKGVRTVAELPGVREAGAGITVVRNAGAGVAGRVQNAGAEVAGKVHGVLKVPNIGRVLTASRTHRSLLSDIDPEDGCPDRFGGGGHEWGWPLKVGWYQPFLHAGNVPSLCLQLRWRVPAAMCMLKATNSSGASCSHEPSSADSVGRVPTAGSALSAGMPAQQVPLTISLARVTPLVLLRVVDPQHAAPYSNGQVAVMVRIRPRAQRDIEAHARELQGLEEECARAWAELSRGSPDLLEIRDVQLHELGDHEVEWACGECGGSCRAGRSALPPGFCSNCGIPLVPQDAEAACEANSPTNASMSECSSFTGGGQGTRTSAPSGRCCVVVRLSSIAVSVVSERVRHELFYLEASGLRLSLKHAHGHERCHFTLRDCRADCQLRVAQLQRKQGRLGWLKRKMFDTQISRFLRETPSVLAAVGPPLRLDAPLPSSSSGALTPSVATIGWASRVHGGQQEAVVWPCLDVNWSRPCIDGNSSLLCMNSFQLGIHQRWELTVDDIAAGALLALYQEVTSAVSSSTGWFDGLEVQRAFSSVLGAAESTFLRAFVPPEPLPIVQIEKEKAEISGIEIAMWGSIDITKLPSSAMPASLAFLLRFLSLSDSIYIEGSTMVFSDWQLPEIRWSIGQMLILVQAKYEGSILLFLSKAIAGSNLLKKSPLNPFHIGQHVAKGFAAALDVIDLSVLTLDHEYMKERKQKRNKQCVESLQEGVEVAGERLWEGFMGISDVIVKPVQHGRTRGIRGIPAGLCHGLLSCFFKPLDGIMQSLRALLQGIAACCLCHFRRKRHRQRSCGQGPERSGSTASMDSLATVESSTGDFGKAVKDHSESLGLSAPCTPRSTVGSGSTPQRRNMFMNSLRDEAVTPPLRNVKHSEPALHGARGLRLPRLLFGEGATLKSFVPWHANLLQCLGPDLAHGTCAAWRLAGDEKDVVQLVLCVSHTRLLLVDLNKGSTEVKRIKRRGSRSLTKEDLKLDLLLEWQERSVDKLRHHQEAAWRRVRQAVPAINSMQSSQLLTVEDFSSRNLMKFQTLRPLMSSLPPVEASSTWSRFTSWCSCLCCCCRRRRSEETCVQLVPQVLGAWGWDSVEEIRFKDAATSEMTSTLSRQSMTSGGASRGQFRERRSLAAILAEEPEGHRSTTWVLTVEDVDGNITEWPLPVSPAPTEELELVCRDVNQAITDLRS